MHPDGSYGGEYGSRNTHHFYPHGFELLAAENAGALQMAELYLRKALPRRTRYFNDDNRMCAHYVYDWFQAWRDYADIPGRSQVACFHANRKRCGLPTPGCWWTRCAPLRDCGGAQGRRDQNHRRAGPVYSDTGRDGAVGGRDGFGVASGQSREMT